MNRLRTVLGLLAGLVLILSSGAHSLLGWPRLADALVQAGAPADLIVVLSLGWHFAGVAMLAFGAIVVLLFTRQVRGRAVSLAPVLAIALAYVAYGTWALTVSHLDPFFLVFLVPGILLLLAAWGRGSDATAG